MPTPHLSIMVVDDAKFSSALIGKTLSQAGYKDIRFAESAAQALAQLEERPASVILADWLMPKMDGLELTGKIRQLDEATDHYTYVILLTGKEGDNILAEAFDRGVDDYISKTQMAEQLIPRIYAADRLCNTLQRLLRQNQMLTSNVHTLEHLNVIDPLTGLGNSRYLNQKLNDSLRQVESRGGALCYLLIGLEDAGQLRQQHGDALFNELMHAVARRLQQLVRPLDTLGRLDDNHFVLITVLSNLQECSPSSFKRLHEGINLKAFKTSTGYVTLKSGISLVGMDNKSLPVAPEDIRQRASQLLPEAYVSGRVTATRMSERG